MNNTAEKVVASQPPLNFINLVNKLSGSQLKLVLVIFAHPGAMTLSDFSENTGLSRQSVVSGLKKLQKLGLLRRQESKDSFIYQVNWDSYRFTCYRCRQSIEPGTEKFHHNMLCEQYIQEKTPAEIMRSKFNQKSRRFRKEIIDEHGGKCEECGTTKNLTIDHINPVSRGGTNDRENLRVLCKRCNSKKGNR